jgi:hypothetical protein
LLTIAFFKCNVNDLFQVFYGSGATLELSEVDAASKALLSIADSGIEEDTIDEIESESPKLSP